MEKKDHVPGNTNNELLTPKNILVKLLRLQKF